MFVGLPNRQSFSNIPLQGVVNDEAEIALKERTPMTSFRQVSTKVWIFAVAYSNTERAVEAQNTLNLILMLR